jgi:hypothetical protein
MQHLVLSEWGPDMSLKALPRKTLLVQVQKRNEARQIVEEWTFVVKEVKDIRSE